MAGQFAAESVVSLHRNTQLAIVSKTEPTSWLEEMGE
jgi:hypothetical protein